MSRVRNTIISISAVSCLVLIGFAREVATISLSNDVDVGDSNRGTFSPCSSDRCKVLGAPRLIAEPFGVDFDQLSVKVAIGGNMPPPTWVAVNVFQFPSLRPVPGLNGPLHLILRDPDVSTPLGLNTFENYNDLVGTALRSPTRSLLLTVSARFPSVGDTITGTATITLSGPGQWVAFDVLGDGGGPEATSIGVIPTRSMEVARALVQLESQAGQHPAVELDVDGIDRPVGFTHLVALPAGARIESATLALSVRSNDPLFSTDFILLDAGVRNVAAGRPGVPLIALSQLPLVPNPFIPVEFSVPIDLGRVPVVLSPPPPGEPFSSDPDREVNLIRQLRDGRLDVILADDSTVHGSVLTINLQDP